jgi:hypothetical protein
MVFFISKPDPYSNPDLEKKKKLISYPQHCYGSGSIPKCFGSGTLDPRSGSKTEQEY